MHSVFGNFIKEVGLRLFFHIIGVYFNWISIVDFVCYIRCILLSTIVTPMLYASKIKRPNFQFYIPTNVKDILEHTFYILSVVTSTLLPDL
jgi:hypothetical protein